MSGTPLTVCLCGFRRDRFWVEMGQFCDKVSSRGEGAVGCYYRTSEGVGGAEPSTGRRRW